MRDNAATDAQKGYRAKPSKTKTVLGSEAYTPRDDQRDRIYQRHQLAAFPRKRNVSMKAQQSGPSAQPCRPCVMHSFMRLQEELSPACPNNVFLQFSLGEQFA